MLEIKGKYNMAKIFTDNVEDAMIGQIIQLCNQEVYKDSKIRIMSDGHSGKGCVVGTSMTIGDRITPNLVGVDINCGMHTVELDVKKLEFDKLDKVIREYVPSGFSARSEAHRFAGQIRLEELYCYDQIKPEYIKKASLAIGTLGGGNHFISLEKSEDGKVYLIIHSGSRRIGLEVAEFYQRVATSYREREVSKELAALSPEDTEKYLHDVDIISEYADLNRKAMADEILTHMKWEVKDSFTTRHNYIDTKNKVLRKGAVSAQKGEILLIPLNMRDGSLICKGKGNEDWNYTAPHGAGRRFSRGEAKRRISVDDFKKSMANVWSTSVSKKTLDEAPMAYKPASEIISNIGDTVEIISKLKPLYNFKAG